MLNADSKCKQTLRIIRGISLYEAADLLPPSVEAGIVRVSFCAVMQAEILRSVRLYEPGS